MQQHEESQTTAEPNSSSAVPLLIQRLAQAGYLASECGLHDEAERIFTCLAAARPGKPAPFIALAIVRSRKGVPVDAIIEHLQSVARTYPDSDMAKAMLGLFLSQSGRDTEARALFDTVRATAHDADALRLVEMCIDEVREAQKKREHQSESLEFFRHSNVRP